ncbi:MAG: cadherin repeat domain-containing protein, partial [Limisphaerales bacterium]
PNIHATTAGYTLTSAPVGASISADGVITWTPTRAQSATTNTVTTVVRNENPYDSVNPQLSATNSFLVIVRHTNAPPALQPIADQSIHYGLPLSVQAVASDPDIPPDILTFSLDVAPASMTINPASGLISWTPALGQIGANTVVVRVTDNGQPPLSDTTTFHVLVLGNQPQLAIEPLAGRLVQINITGDVGTTYELQISTNLLNWDDLVSIPVTSSPYPYIDPGSSTAPLRFYRLKLGSP